jgi:hypothetical protein
MLLKDVDTFLEMSLGDFVIMPISESIPAQT